MARRLTSALFALLWVPVSALAAPGDDALKKGNELIRAGKTAEAIAVYRQASEKNPMNSKLQLVLGLALAQTGESAEAASRLRASVKIESSFAGWYSLGLVNANRNLLPDAVEAYQEALKINPRAYKAWYQLGLVRSAQGQFDAALEAYSKAVQMNPQFEDGYVGLGSAYFWLGDKQAARAQVDRMKLLKMNDRAAALDAWLKKKESGPAETAEPATVLSGQAA